MPFIDQTIYRSFRVPDPANNGKNVDADALPTAVLLKNGTAVGAASVTVTKKTTGFYLLSVLLDAAHNWAILDSVAFQVQYDVSTDTFVRGVDGGTIMPLPTVAPGGNGGLPTVDANNRIVGIQGTKNTLDDLSGADADTLKTISDQLDAGVSVAFSQSASQIANSLTGQNLEIITADRLTISITGAGDISDRTELWFSFKGDRDDADADALILLSEGTGLEKINGGDPGDAANGEITVDDEDAGDLTIVVNEVETAKLAELAPDHGKKRWALKVLSAGSGPYTLLEGKGHINEGIVQDYD